MSYDELMGIVPPAVIMPAIPAEFTELERANAECVLRIQANLRIYLFDYETEQQRFAALDELSHDIQWLALQDKRKA